LTGDKIELLVKCAHLFYDEKCTKSEIASQLGVSATHIKRLLDEALTKGIVRISVVERRDLADLEQALVSKFGLKLARVAPAKSDYETQKIALGQAAAGLFDELVTTGCSVGIGGGGSLKAMVEAIDAHPREILITPMALVGRGPQVEFVDSAFLASLLFYKCSPKSKAMVVGMPPLPKDPKARDTFLKLVDSTIPEVAAVLKQARNSSVAFVGLGGAEPVPELVPLLARSGLASGSFVRKNAVGGINYNYFDKRGQEIAQFYRTVGIAELQAMANDPAKTVVAVAGGAHKLSPILIALRTGMVNALVTDERSALRLTQSTSSSKSNYGRAR
jgi:DNA-binding transcriptional regulator LsrR (DeoR family)